MVIILRVGVLAPLGVLKVATTLTVFLETLTMMAVGSAWAAICLLWLQLDVRWTLLALGLMAITFLPTLPPLLREVLRRTQRGIEPHLMDAWLARIDWSLLGLGWSVMSVTWLANGVSLACVLIASPAAEFSGASWLTIAASALGACAMAVVLGFCLVLARWSRCARSCPVNDAHASRRPDCCAGSSCVAADRLVGYGDALGCGAQIFCQRPDKTLSDEKV